MGEPTWLAAWQHLVANALAAGGLGEKERGIRCGVLSSLSAHFQPASQHTSETPRAAITVGGGALAVPQEALACSLTGAHHSPELAKDSCQRQ